MNNIDVEIEQAQAALAAAKARKEAALKENIARVQAALAEQQAEEERRKVDREVLREEAERKYAERRRREREEQERQQAEERKRQREIEQAHNRAMAEKEEFDRKQREIARIADQAFLVEQEARALEAEKYRVHPVESEPEARIVPEVTVDSDTDGRKRLFARTPAEQNLSPVIPKQSEGHIVPDIFVPRNGKVSDAVFAARLSKPFDFHGQEFTASGYKIRVEDAGGLSHIYWRNGAQVQFVDDGNPFSYRLEIVGKPDQATRATIIGVDELARFDMEELRDEAQPEWSTVSTIIDAETTQGAYTKEVE